MVSAKSALYERATDEAGVPAATPDAFGTSLAGFSGSFGGGGLTCKRVGVSREGRINAVAVTEAFQLGAQPSLVRTPTGGLAGGPWAGRLGVPRAGLWPCIEEKTYAVA